MAKLTAALLVCFAVFGGSAVAQEQKPKILPLQAQCDSLDKMIQVVQEYDEELLFIGEGITFAFPTEQSYTGGMLFLVNQDTGTWSMLQMFGDGVSCLIFNGGKFEPYYGGKPVRR